ncbi:MAG: spore coat protein U domain-containing protein, partial [Acidithiobacillus ferrivorans]
RKKFFACLGVLSTLALGLLSGQAQAATAKTTFSVTAVQGICSKKMGSCSSSNTVYGRIPALQAPSPGAYTDTITVTITY